MIKIQEIKTIKCPGLTSFKVQFDYNPELFSKLIKLDGAKYQKRTKIFEFPVSTLSSIIDICTLYDDIELSLLKIKEEPQNRKPVVRYKTNPYKHQKEGIEFALNHNNFLLLDSPGLGKSMTSIYIAEELKKQDGIKHCLVVCGVNMLKTNWEKEIQKHSKLDCIVIGKKITKTGKVKYEGTQFRKEQLSHKIKEFFVIINIESLRQKEIIQAITKGPNKYDMIVFDECHTAKDINAIQTQGLLKLDSDHKIGMTGTLLLNDPLDLFVPLKWIGVEKSCFSDFRYYYCNYGGPFGTELIGYKNLEVLKDQLQKYSLRRTKDLLDLPEKNIIIEYVDMDAAQQKFYDDIKKGIKDQVDKVRLTTTNLLAMATRLRQATSCPSVLTTDNISSAKIERAIDLVNEIVQNGSKVVIFSVYKETVYRLQERLKQFNPLICTGDIPDDEISKNIDSFQNDEEHKVFIGTFSKCGTGITLTKANYMICIDSCWTAAQNLQAEDRIHRIGSKEPVFIYYLIIIFQDAFCGEGVMLLKIINISVVR